MKKILICLALISGVVYAAPSDDLENYLSQAQTIKADFTQTVISGKTKRVTQGTMEISRPNKFRWNYIKDQQLIISNAKNIYIYDQPQYPHRGVQVDTARHYLPFSLILQTIDSMMYNKMNVLHWHITDEDSFPLKLDKHPELA